MEHIGYYIVYRESDPCYSYFTGSYDECVARLSVLGNGFAIRKM